MLYTIDNAFLTVRISDIGAEMQSIRTADGTEYLWQGSAPFWQSRAIHLFPIVGRLTDGKYLYRGQQYSLGTHGFLRHATMNVQQTGATELAFWMRDTEQTHLQFPFSFHLTVLYRLIENLLTIEYCVRNTDRKPIFFGLGGHPGFNVPIGADTVFEDWELALDCNENTERILFSPSCFLTGKTEPFSQKRIPLTHDLFDNDAIVLQNTGGSVTLQSKLSPRKIRVNYADMPYIGFWHNSKTPAPFVCIEPWASLPSYQDQIDDIETKPDLLRLDPDSECKKSFAIQIF